LKDYVCAKTKKGLLGDDPDFAAIVEHTYASTPDNDRKLSDVVVEAAIKLLRTSTASKDQQAIFHSMTGTPEFGQDVVKAFSHCFRGLSDNAKRAECSNCKKLMTIWDDVEGQFRYCQNCHHEGEVTVSDLPPKG
jgi:hypothetical protein